MKEERNIGVRALTNFFLAITPQKAHWYNLTLSILGPLEAEINAVFPLLSSLLNLDMSTMANVLEVCGLSGRKGRQSLPVFQAWENFITEYKVETEVRTFAIDNKHRYFVQISSFEATRYPVKIPIHYWRDHNNKELSPPRLRINKLTASFVASVGSMGISFGNSFFDNIETDSDAESVAPSIERPIGIINLVEGKFFILLCMLLFYFILAYVFFFFLLLIIDLPDNKTFDANEFPLLISLGCTPMHLDHLTQENSQISWAQQYKVHPWE